MLCYRESNGQNMNALHPSVPVIAILLAGCTTTDVSPYPRQWDAIEPLAEADFTSLSGWYEEVGEQSLSEHDTGVGRTSLTMQLFGFSAPWSEAKRVQILADAETLQVEVWAQDAQLHAQTFSKASGDYFVDGGNISIATHGKAVGEGFIGTFNANVQLFTQAGLLILHEKAQVRGWGLLPHSGSVETWYRFQKLPDTP